MSKWISVNEALPKAHQQVLVVCVNPQNHMQRHVSLCTFYGATGGVRGRMWSGWKTVTHWMPLPELPEEELETFGKMQGIVNEMETRRLEREIKAYNGPHLEEESEG